MSSVDLPEIVRNIKTDIFSFTSLQATAIWTAPLFLQLSLTCSQHWSAQVFEVLKWAISPSTYLKYYTHLHRSAAATTTPHSPWILLFLLLSHPPPAFPWALITRVSVTPSMDARIKSLPVSSNIPAQTDWLLLPVDRQGEQQSWRHLWGSSCRKSKAWLSLGQSSHRNRQHRSFPSPKLRDAFLLQIK